MVKHAPILYSDDLETITDDESKVIEMIITAMTSAAKITANKEGGHHVRTSHAKSHGLLKGELEVLPELPEMLAQGLFAESRTYPVVARLAHVPGEILDDRTVSTPKGFAFKVFDVEGPKFLSHALETTQDFVFNTGENFNASDAKTFLALVGPVDNSAPVLPEAAKKVVSSVARGLDAATRAVGIESANLDFFGHAMAHPLAETYFSQVPHRYGDYVAKFRLSPKSVGLLELARETFQVDGPNGLRDAVAGWFRENPAAFELSVQLCTDAASMPIEDAHAKWWQDESPYQPVAVLRFEPQNAYSEARRDYVDENLSFCPSHVLEAHRPLGSVSRARLQVYRVMADLRRRANGRPTTEPASLAEIPD